MLSSATWICLENQRVTLDSYPRALARKKNEIPRLLTNRRSSAKVVMTEPTIAHSVKEVLVARVAYGLRSQGSLLPVPILSTGYSTGRRENLGTRLFARLYLACSRLRDGGGKSFSNKKCEKRARVGERHHRPLSQVVRVLFSLCSF